MHDTRGLESRRKAERFKKLVANSKFTEKDAEEMSDKIKASMHKHLVDEGFI